MSEIINKGSIEIRPVPSKKWHGNTGTSSITRPKLIEALPDDTSNYAIALGRDKNIDYTENGVDMKLSELEYYSKLIGQDLSTQFIADKAHPFYNSRSGRIKLENNTMFLNLNNPIEYVRYAIIKKSPSVAASLKAFEDGKYPQATHYIVDENYELEQYKEKRNKRDTVIKRLSSMSKEEKGNLLFLLSGKNSSEQSEDFIDMHIENAIDKNITEVLSYLDMNKSDFLLTALITKAVKYNFIIREGLKYKYQGALLGNSLDEVINYLKDDENQTFKIELTNKVESI